jgi:hypothetical protein
LKWIFWCLIQEISWNKLSGVLSGAEEKGSVSSLFVGTSVVDIQLRGS